MNPTEWLDEVWESTLPSSSKLLCAYLRKFLHNGKQTCWPSKARMMAETGLTKRTIQKHLTALDKEGWLKIDKSNGGRNNRYTIQQVLNSTGAKSDIELVLNRHLDRVKIAPLKTNRKTNRKTNGYKLDAMDRLVDRTWAEVILND